MGNCMRSPPKEKVRVLIHNNGGEEEFTVSTRVKKITSGPYNGFKLLHHAQPYLPLPPNAKLKSGEVYYLVPKVAQPRSPQLAHKLISDNSSRGQSVKIVVTKQQLELLLKSTKKFQSDGNAIRFMESFCEREGCRKWWPSLPTIPEGQNILE